MFVQYKELVVRLSGITLLAVLILLFFPVSSTILYTQYDWDYVVFKVIGDSWSEGLIPYRDMFDHKGPLIYLIQIIGGFVPQPKLGVWLLELLFIVISCELLFRCGWLLNVRRRLNYIALLVALICYSIFVDGGNSVEIWSLPFEIYPLYLVLGYLQGRNSRLFLISLLTGICFGLVSLIRINNNILIVSLVFFISAYLIYKRLIKDLLQSTCAFIIGVVIITVPTVLYFYRNDALADFIWCNITFNLHYMKNFGTLIMMDYIKNVLYLSPCLLLIPISYFYGRNNGFKYCLLFSIYGLLSFLLLYNRIPFAHYWILIIPACCLCIQLLSGLRRSIVYSVFLFFTLYVCGGYYRLVYSRILSFEFHFSRHERESLLGESYIAEVIPKYDLDSVYTCGEMKAAGVLNALGYSPVGKYFFMQSELSKVDNETNTDIRKHFVEANPKWVILCNESRDGVIGNLLINYQEVKPAKTNAIQPYGWRIYHRKD